MRYVLDASVALKSDELRIRSVRGVGNHLRLTDASLLPTMIL